MNRVSVNSNTEDGEKLRLCSQIQTQIQRSLAKNSLVVLSSHHNCQQNASTFLVLLERMITYRTCKAKLTVVE